MWEQEKKLKADKRKETKMIHYQKISLEKEKLMWEQEKKNMFYDVSTLDPDQKTYVLARRVQIAAQNTAPFNAGFGGGFNASSDVSGGDVNRETI
jgi:methionyl-tRNA formyltransferase